MGWVQDLMVRIRGDKSQLDSTLSQTHSSISSWATKVMGLIGAAFGISAIVNFSKEAMKLAASAEGVKNAFMKIGDARSVLDDMKKATRGVIEESDLMALAIKAQNFKIPLQDLAKYLEFATSRAVITGKSVNELVETIVTGIGRKSSRSMIQLGLSAKDVQEAFKTTGGFMALVTSELAKMGPVADTASIRFGQLSANVKNLKEAWGEFLNNSVLIQKAVEGTTLRLQILADPRLSFFSKMMMSGKDYLKFLDDQKKSEEALAIVRKETVKEVVPILEKQAVTIKTLSDELAKYKDDLQNANIVDLAYIRTLTEKIRLTEAYIKLLQSGQAIPIGTKAPSMISGKPMESGIEKPIPGLAPNYPAEIEAKVMIGGEVFNMSELSNIQKQWVESWQKAANEVASFIAEAFIGVFEAIGKGSFKGLGENLLKGFGQLLSSLGKLLVSMGLTMLLALTLMKTPSIPTAIAAIAAGAAAMAIGGLIMGAASKGSENLAGGSGGGSSTGMARANSGNLKVIVEGKISGKDIVLVGKRWVDSNDRET